MYVKEIKLTVTVPANTTKGSRLKVSFVDDPSKGAKDYLQVPVTEYWLIEDLYVTTSPGVDLNIEFVKNGRKVLQRSPALSSMLINQPARKTIDPMLFRPGEILEGTAITLADAGSSEVNVEAYISVRVFEDESELEDYGIEVY